MQWDQNENKRSNSSQATMQKSKSKKESRSSKKLNQRNVSAGDFIDYHQ